MSTASEGAKISVGMASLRNQLNDSSWWNAGGMAMAVWILATVLLGGRTVSEELAPVDRPRPDGFSFSAGTCEQGPAFCAVATPRAWAPAEIEVVREALDEIEASELGRRIVQRAGANGFRTLRRFAQAAQPSAQGGYDAEPLIVATAHTDDGHAIRTIDLTDRFFERQSARDHFSGEPGYLLTTEILAHELVHAMDLAQQYSSNPEFRKVARLGMPATLQREADRVNAEREHLNGEKRYEASWQVSRSFGINRLKGRLPSLQALDSYREAFAEFGAHLVLDPNARRRLEPRVLLYFDRAVSDAP